MLGQRIIEAFVLVLYCFTVQSLDCELEAGGMGVGFSVCVCADVGLL